MVDRKPDDDKAKKKGKPDGMPPAGPHARPELTDPGRTPGSGALPGEEDESIPPTG